MKKTNLITAILGIGLITYYLTSCNSCNRRDIAYELVEVDSTGIDASFRARDNQPLVLAKGPVWETWKKLHKACMENAFFRNPTYLGLSNTVDLGSVYSKSGDVLEWDFNKLFSDQDRKKVINFGQPQPCTYTEQLKVDFQSFLATELPSTGVEGELSAAIRNNKDISVKIDNWQIDNLVKRELKMLLDSSTNPRVMQFKKDLLEKKMIMVSQAARINGFSSIIKLETDMSASLEAKLKEGIVKNIGNTQAKIKFEYSTSKEIKVTTQGSFVVFVDFIRAKRVND
ncbi:hypothetical protein [Pedobacter chitinilyticus]|uniref:Uncharacterized protein n=1 Tax=Pedobacter chitinilyticus TaxID=2233776 RepID=A0A3S3PP00_9SPHI|nr:hypothetical protein [Pedobacter chitinilyticus]RWU08163.1 hypothetical protein DPV69_07215 [Pedobacter chitinilyticus]